ncbi:MAG: 3-methylornithyl-N6-L-lysine dehydrogenase PylD [Candidatus Aminicenantes bacterium]|nr:3-methylornithyl-N6-L-lysine dehydrogenase PylD [Candidatus Aminicenantes bacterium]
MTRLKVEDIKGIAGSLQQYDEELRRKTGCTLQEIACHAVGIKKTSLLPSMTVVKAAVVPIKSGKGIIGGFAQSVQAILAHIGLDAFVTGQSDAAGMAEAFEKKARLVFAADDSRFVAFNLEKRTVVDNAAAAGKGFAAGLDLLAGGVKGKKVLVLGCGPVGAAAVFALTGFGAQVSVYDIDPERSRQPAKKISVKAYHDNLPLALSEHRLIIDATDAPGIISEEFIRPGTFIAAPGMPLGLTRRAVKKIGDRLLHDPLQTGVAVMAVEALHPSAPHA